MSIAPDRRSSLIARLANGGDSDAWRAFASLHEPFIHRQPRRFGLQRDDALPLNHDAFDPFDGAVFWIEAMAREREQHPDLLPARLDSVSQDGLPSTSDDPTN